MVHNSGLWDGFKIKMAYKRYGEGREKKKRLNLDILLLNGSL